MNHEFVRRLIWIAGLFCLLCLGVSCGSPPPAKPVDIAAGDTCYHCRRPIADKRFAAEFVTKDGFVRKFDDIGCMIAHAKKGRADSVVAFFTVDYDKKDWRKADEMSFLRSKNLPTPAGGGIAAFGDNARAQSLAKQFQGQAVAFGELMK